MKHALACCAFGLCTVCPPPNTDRCQEPNLCVDDLQFVLILDECSFSLQRASSMLGVNNHELAHRVANMELHVLTHTQQTCTHTNTQTHKHNTHTHTHAHIQTHKHTNTTHTHTHTLTHNTDRVLCDAPVIKELEVGQVGHNKCFILCILAQRVAGQIQAAQAAKTAQVHNGRILKAGQQVVPNGQHLQVLELVQILDALDAVVVYAQIPELCQLGQAFQLLDAVE